LLDIPIIELAVPLSCLRALFNARISYASRQMRGPQAGPSNIGVALTLEEY
jgi:hypothetical protein